MATRKTGKGDDNWPENEGLGRIQPSKPGTAEQTIVSAGFRLLERVLLIIVAIMTLIAAGLEIQRLYVSGSVDLADILLMFLYTEVIAMVAVFYTGKGSLFIYPIFVAITALARLIVLQGKDMAPENIVFEALAILLLALAIALLIRVRNR